MSEVGLAQRVLTLRMFLSIWGSCDIRGSRGIWDSHLSVDTAEL